MGIKNSNNVKQRYIKKGKSNIIQDVSENDLDAVRYIFNVGDVENFGRATDEQKYLSAYFDPKELDVDVYAMGYFDDGMLEGTAKFDNDVLMDEEMAEWRDAIDNTGGLFNFTREQMVFFLKEYRGYVGSKYKGQSDDIIDDLTEEELAELLNMTVPRLLHAEWEDPKWSYSKKTLNKFSVNKKNNKDKKTIEDIKPILNGKRAAVDIDGVLVDFGKECFAPAAEEILGRKLNINDADSWDLTKKYDITESEVKKVWESKELEKYMLSAPPIKGVKELIKTLSSDSIYLTHRGSTTPENHADITYEWLKNNGFPEFDIYSSKNKTKVLKENKITNIIEDSPNNIEKITDPKITIFMPEHPYNKNVIGLDKNIIRFIFD